MRPWKLTVMMSARGGASRWGREERIGWGRGGEDDLYTVGLAPFSVVAARLVEAQLQPPTPQPVCKGVCCPYSHSRGAPLSA